MIFKPRNTAIFCVQVICLIWAQKAVAQLEYETLSTTQGLSQGMVYDILQDREGFIWIGTKDGLNRYDGYSFKVFTNDRFNDKSLSSNSINKLFEDSKGRIWVGTENEGLNVYDKKSGNFLRIKSSTTNPKSLSGNVIKIMEEMPGGRMLISADDGKINIVTLKDNFLDKDVSPIITTISMPNNTKVYGIGNDKNKNTWIGGMDGTVYQFDPKNYNFILLPNAQLLNNGYLTKGGDILINCNLYLYDRNNLTPLFDTKKYPEGNIIFKPNSALWDKHHRETSFYDVSTRGMDKIIKWGLKLPEKRIIYPFIFDKSGLIWCGTVGYGLRKYNVEKDKFNTQLIGYSTYSIVPISINDVFLGDVGYQWKRNKNKIIQENAFANIPQVTQIDNFIISKTGEYWLKSDNKGYFKYNPVNNKLTSYPNINNYKGMGSKQPMMEDSKNRIWFTGLGGNITLLHTDTEKLTNFNINTNAAKKLPDIAIVTALYEDTNGSYWLGTVDGFANVQLAKSPDADPQIKWYYTSSNPNSLSYSHVSCFLDDPSNPNYLWIGTKGGGLNRLDKSTGNYFHLTLKDGLPDNVVYGLLTDEAGNIWGSTNRGIFCLIQSKNSNKESWTFRNFTKEDGLQDDEFNTNAYKNISKEILAFGGVNGLNIFSPKEILSKNFKPQVFITNILVGNLPVQPKDKTNILSKTIEQSTSITLNYLQDILTLEFSSLDFTAPLQNKYRYQLVGVDKEWVESGTRRSATYLHLPSGNYIFKVQGSNSQGIWSSTTSQLKIIVNPPWWQSWWAYLIYTVVLGFSIRAYFKFRVNKAKLENQLHFEQKEAKRIKELDAVKTHLYTNMTHEFRTPLTVILGMVQQIRRSATDHLETGLDMIERNGNSLLRLVNEMLDLSKLEAGKMELNLVQGDVINFIRYIVESFHSIAESQGKKMHYLASVDFVFTTYDAEKIRQIITNLLSNALKFTAPKGDIYISISLLNEKSNELCIKVKDTGTGIPEDQILHIFDRFYQADITHTRNAEGTGIGLALTKELVQLMNGSISVKSPPVGSKKGTEFIVIIPLNIVEEFIETNESTYVPNNETTTPPILKSQESFENIILPNNGKELILLVEDNADVVAYTASCLNDYRLAVGRDGREGFDIATDLIPDLIITDVMMPFMDGFEMTKKLRQDERTSHVPIIMLTAKADMESKLEGIQYGAEAYLEKPFYKDELLLRIKKLLEQRKHLQLVYSKLAGVTIPEKEEMIVDEIASPADKITLPPIEDKFVKKVREEIEINLHLEDYNVEQMSKHLFMSYSQLHRKLSALIGQSPNQYIKGLRIEKAKELLRSSDDTIANIASQCGFSDAGYFGKVFKQEVGKTPMEWRNEDS